MMLRSAKPLLYALLLSFLIHFAILLGPALELPDWTPAPQLTVELQAPPPKPVAPIAAAPAKPRPQPRKAAPPTPPLAAPIAAAPEAVATAPQPTPPPFTAPEPTPPPPQPNIAAQRAFPAQVEVVYAVHRGDQGIRLGRTTHKWRIAKNQYLLTSTTEATGLVSLFYSGRYIMTSKGDITPDGLQPASFWIQRGQSDNRTESAEFNWEAKTLDYGKGTERNNVSITSGAQDQLSVFYQLALTAPHRARLDIALTTGRKFNQHSYQMVGEEMLDTVFGKLKVEHLTRVTAKEKGDSADIWLAPDYHYLPVRFRLGTRDGEVLDHWIAELRVEGQRVETKSEEP